MIFARFYRHDMILGEPDIETGFSVLLNRSQEGMHEEATLAAHRAEADAYQLYEGTTFKLAKPLSFKHHLK